jgi:cytochrome c oxidase subunit II
MLAGILLTMISIWYGHNHGLMPAQASRDAVQIDALFDSMMVVGTGIFLLVWGVIIICMIKFRRAPGDETDGPHIEGNVLLEIVWTAIPAVIAFIIAVYSFDIYSEMGGFDPEAADDPGIVQVAMAGDASPTSLIPQQKHSHHHHMALGIGASDAESKNQPDLTVNVTGLQYAWIFNYPDGVISGELHLPLNKDAKLLLKAQDVIHAFWLPEFRLKQDTLPGQDSELRFTPTRLGNYPVICAELCGPYHGGMVTRLYVETPEDYAKWFDGQKVAMKTDPSRTVAIAPQDSAVTALKADQKADQKTDQKDQMAIHAAHLGIPQQAIEQAQQHQG